MVTGKYKLPTEITRTLTTPQALMNPNQGLHNPESTKTNGSIVWDVIFRPYLHVFGELDLDGMYDELQQGNLLLNT